MTKGTLILVSKEHNVSSTVVSFYVDEREYLKSKSAFGILKF